MLGLLVGCTGHSGPQSRATLAAPTATSSQAPQAPDAEVECVGGEIWRPGDTTACSGHCDAQSFIYSRCVGSRREELAVRAPCECGVDSSSPALSGCRFDRLSLVPLQVVPATGKLVTAVDGCKLELTCGPGKLTISCDGEQDGTGTSLCDCYLDGRTVRLPKSDPWPGEGVDTCHAAAAACLQAASNAGLSSAPGSAPAASAIRAAPRQP